MKAKNKPNLFSIEKFILVLSASYASYNFGLVGGYIEGTRFSIGGLIAGVIVNVSLALASSRYGSLKGIGRIKQAKFAFVVLMLISPLIVSPVIYYKLPSTFLELWWIRVIWSVAWPFVADVAIVLAGSVSGKGLISLAESPKSATVSATTPKASARSAKVSPTSAADYPRKCDYCDAQIKSPNAVGGHMKKWHTELCKTVNPVPLSSEFEEIAKKGMKP